MGHFQLSSTARKDLTDIKQYTVQTWGHEQAISYLSELYTAIKTIADMPTIGKKRPEFSEQVFSFAYANHVIYYIRNANMIIVSAVLHKSMVPELHIDLEN